MKTMVREMRYKETKNKKETKKPKLNKICHVMRRDKVGESRGEITS